MKPANPVRIAAAFIGAVLSLNLPASAMSADDLARLLREPAPAQRPSNERAWTDPFRNDPILVSRWGPGDPNLAVTKFHVFLPKSRVAATQPK